MKITAYFAKTRMQFIVLFVLVAFYIIADLCCCVWVFPLHTYAGETGKSCPVKTLVDLGQSMGQIYDFQRDDLRVMAMLGFFVGQASLLSLWADRCPIKSYVRIPLALVGIAGLSCLTSRHLKEVPLIGYNRSADYFYLYGVHALLLILILTAARISNVLYKLIRSRYSEHNTAKAQFTIGSMLIWTTLVAFFLGVGKLVLSEREWSPTNRSVDHFAAIGAVNAILAMLMITVILGFKSKWGRRLFPIALMLTVAAIQPLSWFTIYLIDLNTFPLLELRQGPVVLGMCIGLVILADVQVLTIIATLLPLRWFGLLGGNQETTISKELT